MKRLIFLLAAFLCLTSYAQTEEASVRLYEKGQTLMFVLEDDTFYCGMYFFPKTKTREEARVDMEMRDYEKSSKVQKMTFKPVVDGSTIKLYAKDGSYFGHVLFHYDQAFVYNTDGNFLFKIPRWKR